MDYNEFANAIKANHPEYADRDNAVLARAMLSKFPEYADRVDTSNIPSNQTPTNQLVAKAALQGFDALNPEEQNVVKSSFPSSHAAKTGMKFEDFVNTINQRAQENKDAQAQYDNSITPEGQSTQAIFPNASRSAENGNDVKVSDVLSDVLSLPGRSLVGGLNATGQILKAPIEYGLKGLSNLASEKSGGAINPVENEFENPLPSAGQSFMESMQSPEGSNVVSSIIKDPLTLPSLAIPGGEVGLTKGLYSALGSPASKVLNTAVGKVVSDYAPQIAMSEGYNLGENYLHNRPLTDNTAISLVTPVAGNLASNYLKNKAIENFPINATVENLENRGKNGSQFEFSPEDISYIYSKTSNNPFSWSREGLRTAGEKIKKGASEDFEYASKAADKGAETYGYPYGSIGYKDLYNELKEGMVSELKESKSPNRSISTDDIESYVKDLMNGIASPMDIITERNTNLANLERYKNQGQAVPLSQIGHIQGILNNVGQKSFEKRPNDNQILAKTAHDVLNKRVLGIGSETPSEHLVYNPTFEHMLRENQKGTLNERIKVPGGDMSRLDIMRSLGIYNEPLESKFGMNIYDKNSPYAIKQNENKLSGNYSDFMSPTAVHDYALASKLAKGLSKTPNKNRPFRLNLGPISPYFYPEWNYILPNAEYKGSALLKGLQNKGPILFGDQKQGSKTQDIKAQGKKKK